MTLESGLGHRTVPLLLAESSFSGQAKNWSSLLHLKADMTLEVRTDHRAAGPSKCRSRAPSGDPIPLSLGELLQREPRRVGAADRADRRRVAPVEPGAGGAPVGSAQLVPRPPLTAHPRHFPLPDEKQPGPGQEPRSRRRLCHPAGAPDGGQHLLQGHLERHRVPKQPERLPQPGQGDATSSEPAAAGGETSSLTVCSTPSPSRRSRRAPAPTTTAL